MYNWRDRCFKNFGKEDNIEDLLLAVNGSILEYDPLSLRVEMRTLRKGINHENILWSPIDKICRFNGFYYRYEDKKINK